MALAPLSQIIKIKPRPQTTLQLLTAIEDPVGTVSDYVFTPSIKEHISILLDSLRSLHGGGYWVLSEYGGGKTHFLATVASLLSATHQVADHVADDEIQRDVRLLRSQRLFPVAFSLIGRTDMLGRRNALFSILESEIRNAARDLLGNEIVLTLPEEVRRWWKHLGEGTRSDLSQHYTESFGKSPDEDYEDSAEQWSERIAVNARALGIGIDVASSPLDRLTSVYRQIVNEDTGFTGLLIVIDEFASWQDQRPEGGTAYSEDENLLQALAEVLPRDRGLNIFTLVASQKPMPRKFEGSRFRQFDVLRPSNDGTSPSFEYAMVVASRVRELEEYRYPEIEEYYEHYRTRFDFARELSLEDFTTIFPMQPLSFDLLRRITSNLTSARTGINVLWEVLSQWEQATPELQPSLMDTRRLIAAGDLLESDSLDQDLQQSGRYQAAHRAYKQAIEQVRRLESRGSLFESDLPVATAIIKTLFLWYCSRDGQMSMTLSELTEAISPEEGFLDSPQDTLLSVLAAMEDVPQVEFDTMTGELSFRSEVTTGRSPAEVFDGYRSGFDNPNALNVQWRQYLTNPNLAVGALSSMLRDLENGTPQKCSVTYGGINYEGEAVATADWMAEWGDQLPFDSHFRLVFMLSDEVAVTSELLEDNRVLVCVPGPLSDDNMDAIATVLALDKMQEDYAFRQDDEALRVNLYVETQRSNARQALLMAQRDFYRRGQIVTRQGIALDANELFRTETDIFGRLTTPLFEVIFKDRPIGDFRRKRNMNLNTETRRIFTGLWEQEPERSTRNALENFAVGLGLAQRDKPLTFDPRNCRAFEIIRPLYENALSNYRMLTALDVYEKLAGVGIPARLATLYLLCFVRANPDVELLLNTNHRLRLGGGGQLQSDRIFSNIVPRIEWDSRAFATATFFDSLVGRSGPIWNECLEWTRKFDSELKTASTPERIEEETGRFLNTLEAERVRLQDAVRQIDTLEQQMNGSIRKSVKESAEVVGRLTQSNTLEQFMETLQTSGIESSDELLEAVLHARNLNQLGQSAAEITASYAYLSAVSADRLGDFVGLGEDRASLIADLNLDDLVSDPDRWSYIRTRFDMWKRAYALEYRKSHRDYHVEASEVCRRIGEALTALTALENLEGLHQLTQTAQAPRLKERIDVLQRAITECNPIIGSSKLEAAPVCTDCRIRLGDKPEVGDLDPLELSISGALNALIDILSSDAIEKVLAESDSPIVKELHVFLARKDLPEIVRLLKDEGNTQLLGAVLDGGGNRGVIVRDINIVRELSIEYPTVSLDSLHEVADRFRELVEGALRRQQERAGSNATVEVRLR